MLTLEEIKEKLADRRIPVISERTGLPHSTIYAVRDGRSKNPAYDTLKALSDYFTDNQQAA